MKKLGKKKKGIIISIVSVVMAGVMGVTGFLMFGKNKKKETGGSNNSISASNSVDGLETGNLDSLGEQLPTEGKKSEYTKVSGDINVEDIVRGADGVLYDSEESAKNSSKVGTSEIDTKGGSLVVSDNGKVYTKEEGYEIVDEKGNVIASGNGSVPENYEEEGIDYVECPCDYYDDAGNLVHSTGELITPDELERCKQYYHTTKPEKDEYVKVEEEIIYFDENYTNLKEDKEKIENDEVKEIIYDEKYIDSEEKNKETEEVEVSDEATIVEEAKTTNSTENLTSNGTYTAYGQTYASYEDYQQYIIDDGAGYGEIDGVIQPIGDYEIEDQYQYTK